MKVAMLERFADPSRRCDPALLGLATGDAGWVDLPDPLREPGRFLHDVPKAIVDWMTVPASMHDLMALACASARTRGARFGALLRAPGLLRRLRAGEIGAFACYSAKDFALADHLASVAGTPCRELLAHGTQYFGEFAFEMLAVVPYAYWLHREGRLEFTVSTPDTRCLYWFSPHHVERPLARRYVPITEYPAGVPGRLRYDRKAFPEVLDTTRWAAPPYREVYADQRFRFERPTVVVCNKATAEQYRWHRTPTNFLPTDLLLALIGALRTRFQVVYDRPRSEDIVNDHQAIREAGDIDAVTGAYPDVLTIQQLRARHPGLSFNELQLRLFAACERFVSVLGGSSYLASYFGGTNVVYARRGWEVACGAYDRWFDRFSGARVVAVSDARELMAAVEREL